MAFQVYNILCSDLFVYLKRKKEKDLSIYILIKGVIKQGLLTFDLLLSAATRMLQYSNKLSLKFTLILLLLPVLFLIIL